MSELRVALTFDAEHPSRTPSRADGADRILDILREAGVPATFFVQGRWATAYPETARRIAAEGHRIGNHSNYHAPMTLLSPEGIRADVQEAERRIVDVTGADPRPWFRCPFGDGADRPDVLEALHAVGYRNGPYDVDSGDWHTGSSPEDVAAAVVGGVDGATGSSIVLFHTWPASTTAALPLVVERLRDRGVSFVTIQEVAGGS